MVFPWSNHLQIATMRIKKDIITLTCEMNSLNLTIMMKYMPKMTINYSLKRSITMPMKLLLNIMMLMLMNPTLRLNLLKKTLN